MITRLIRKIIWKGVYTTKRNKKIFKKLVFTNIKVCLGILIAMLCASLILKWQASIKLNNINTQYNHEYITTVVINDRLCDIYSYKDSKVYYQYDAGINSDNGYMKIKDLLDNVKVNNIQDILNK